MHWAYSHLDLPTVTDSGYEDSGIGVFTSVKQPASDQVLDAENRNRNAPLKGLRHLGERGFALLTGRWRALRHHYQPTQDQQYRQSRAVTHTF